MDTRTPAEIAYDAQRLSRTPIVNIELELAREADRVLAEPNEAAQLDIMIEILTELVEDEPAERDAWDEIIDDLLDNAMPNTTPNTRAMLTTAEARTYIVKAGFEAAQRCLVTSDENHCIMPEDAAKGFYEAYMTALGRALHIAKQRDDAQAAA